jgi:hypothetical protein
MKNIFAIGTVVASLGVAAPALARPVDVTVEMAVYGGNRAYLAGYLVDPAGKYVGTVMVAGSRDKYFEHLSRWYRLFQRAGQPVDGTTGASIGTGETMNAHFDIPDSMLNAGYTLRIESAVENQNYFPDDAAVVMEDANNGTAKRGTGYIRNVTIAY